MKAPGRQNGSLTPNAPTCAGKQERVGASRLALGPSPPSRRCARRLGASTNLPRRRRGGREAPPNRVNCALCLRVPRCPAAWRMRSACRHRTRPPRDRDRSPSSRTPPVLDFEMVRLDHGARDQDQHHLVDNPLARNLARAMGTRSVERRQVPDSSGRTPEVRARRRRTRRHLHCRGRARTAEWCAPSPPCRDRFPR